ncbi:SDR family oxidoreductase [Nitrincola schmidtii]|uniref:SDR family oxidoreductase n=1 Tax=Nitrincola schmidtii TaxID=1730894 RepID=UPI00124F5503|nr:SDR family oxidoreductase [Nitrincola schmidtii]
MQTILITGCSSGIGKHCAIRLKELGYQVFATARHYDDVKALKADGFNALQLDLDSSESIQQAVNEVFEQTGGRLDALFNNGAYGQPGAAEDLTRDVLRQQFESNFFGWVELTNRILPIMRQQGHGRIIMNSSVLGFVALKYRGAYNASKFAIEGITDTYRLELKGSGIDICLIEPGPVESDFRQNALAAFKRNIVIENSPHKAVYTQVMQRLSDGDPKSGAFTLPPESVFKSLKHALESPRPKARYYVTTPTYLFGFLKRILPTRWLDVILSRSSN